MWGPSVHTYAVKAAGGIEALALTAQDEKSWKDAVNNFVKTGEPVK